MTGPAPHVTLSGVSVCRGGRVLLRDLELAIPRGTFVALTGPSGVGKSSLLACLAGLLAPADGRVSVSEANGKTGAPEDFRRDMGFVFQHLRLNPGLSAETNVLCGLLGRRPWWRTLLGFARDDREQAHALLNRFGIAARAGVSVAELSGGERQRVALARALIANPGILFADEPVSHLDAPLAAEIIGFLQAETRARGRTVFCALHDPGLVERFADMTLHLDRESKNGWTLQPTAA